MELKVPAKDFKVALEHVQAACAKKTTMPVLQNVLFQSLSNEKVKITATDIKQQISYVLDCENSGDIFTTVEFDKLFKLAAKYPSEQMVKIVFKSDSATVTCARSKGLLKSLPAQDFPVQSIEKCNFSKVSFQGSALVDAFKKAASMAGQNDVRHYLNGVGIDIKPSYTNVVATDGHRLIKISLDCVNESDLDRVIIIPNEAVAGFIKSLDEQPVNMNIAESFVQFSDDVVEFQTQLVDGRFPDYARVVPKLNSLEFTFIGKEIKDAVSRVSIFGDGKTTPLRLNISGNECNITVAGKDNTQGDEVINCVSSSEIEMGVNAQYLTDAVNKVESDEVKVLMKDANTAMLIKDGQTEIVVMPMRL